MGKKLVCGFYWVKCRAGARWEVVEFDGVTWLGGLGDDMPLYLIGPRIPEPPH